MRLPGLVTALIVLTLPGTALGYSGSITNVAPTANGQVTVTYTTNFDVCDPDGYCGWYPHAWEVPASRPCSEDKTHLTYVGGPGDDIHAKPGSETATESFSPHFSPTRICLYVRHSNREYLIAEHVYTPSGSPRPMGITEARDLVPRVLRKRYGARFVRRTGRLRRACSRLSAEKVRCRVGWSYRTHRYAGSVTLQNDPDDPLNSFAYSLRIRRQLR